MALKSVLKNESKDVFKISHNGTNYEIAPGESITLNRRTAVAIRGLYTPPTRKVSLSITHLNEEQTDAFKKGTAVEPEAQKIYVDPETGNEYKSKAGLLAALRAKAKKDNIDDTSSITRDDS